MTTATRTRTKVGENLDTLIAQIKTEVSAAEGAASDAAEHARQAGEYLIRAKKAVPRGEWKKWVSANIALKVRTAQQYMDLSRNWAKVQQYKRGSVALKSVRAALRAMGKGGTAKKKRPEITSATIRAAIAKTDLVGKVTPADVMKLLQELHLMRKDKP